MQRPERARKPLDLTPDLVARVPPFIGPPNNTPPGRTKARPEAHQAMVARLLATRPASADETWIFAYGSLMWNPCFAFTHERLARAQGWHRAFCLGWMYQFRGSVRHPGLMMALCRGGSCTGVAFCLPPDSVAQSLLTLIEREMPFEPAGMQARWMKLHTASGPLFAIGFTIDPRSDAYVGGLPEADIITSLATAAGERGSMAEYLLGTVQHLEQRGIHDSHLWHMQSEVARLLAALPPPRQQPPG